jgi:hypothetical protein
LLLALQVNMPRSVSKGSGDEVDCDTIVEVSRYGHAKQMTIILSRHMLPSCRHGNIPTRRRAFFAVVTVMEPLGIAASCATPAARCKGP